MTPVPNIEGVVEPYSGKLVMITEQYIQNFLIRKQRDHGLRDIRNGRTAPLWDIVDTSDPDGLAEFKRRLEVFINHGDSAMSGDAAVRNCKAFYDANFPQTPAEKLIADLEAKGE